MAEWLFEAGIGERRAALVEDGTIVEARVERDDRTRVGLVAAGRVREVLRRHAVVELDDGTHVTVAPPAGLAQGRRTTVAITREAIPEAGRTKLPRGIVTDEAPRPAPTLRDRLAGAPVRECRAHEADAFEAAGWSEAIEEARTGEIVFPGGALRLSPTPAMTLFDVDGDADAAPLAIAAATAVAAAIRRHDIGGSIGIDFPTVTGKDARNAVAAAIDAGLPQPFERTALNGFGFLQIVRPRPRASLPEIVRMHPVETAALAALRSIERTPPGASNAWALPAVVRARIESRADWLTEVMRRTGRTPIFTP